MQEPIDIPVPEKLRPLIPKFIERTTAQAEQMRAALAAGDAATLEQIGHRLRGSAGGFGFDELGRIAARIEAAAKAGDTASFPKLVAEFGDHLSRARVRYV